MHTGILSIFVDFDGTITERDVGDSIFERFLRPDLLEAGWHSHIIEEWKAGRLSSRDCLVRECENTVVTRDKLDALLDGHTLTSGFGDLVRYCERNDVPLTILSDGLDYYIEYILARHGLGGIPCRANRMSFTESSIRVEFPYEQQGCGRCGNCKRRHIETDRRGGERIVYIGDGYSDRFAIRSADMIFARRDLARFCSHSGIEYFPYEDFQEVIGRIELLTGAGAAAPLSIVQASESLTGGAEGTPESADVSGEAAGSGHGTV
jgi:2-hydroxy-3-keto-5-methylthiopentenyl-1-phosphate phosphatase